MTDICAAGATRRDLMKSAKKEKLANNHNLSLKGIDDLRLTMPKGNIQHGYQSYVCLLNLQKKFTKL